MNATETRNHLRHVAASLMDHLVDQLDAAVATYNDAGPRYWRGVGDLENAVGQLARMIETLSNGSVTAQDARDTAEECVAECRIN